MRAEAVRAGAVRAVAAARAAAVRAAAAAMAVALSDSWSIKASWSGVMIESTRFSEKASADESSLRSS